MTLLPFPVFIIATNFVLGRSITWFGHKCRFTTHLDDDRQTCAGSSESHIDQLLPRKSNRSWHLYGEVGRESVFQTMPKNLQPSWMSQIRPTCNDRQAHTLTQNCVLFSL